MTSTPPLPVAYMLTRSGLVRVTGAAAVAAAIAPARMVVPATARTSVDFIQFPNWMDVGRSARCNGGRPTLTVIGVTGIVRRSNAGDRNEMAARRRP